MGVFLFPLLQSAMTCRFGDMKPMLCTTYAGDLPSSSVIVEPKLDGIRVVAEINRVLGTVRFLTRNGKEIASLSHLASEVRAFADSLGLNDRSFCLDGEAVCGDFFDGIGALRSKKPVKSAVIYFFDVFSRLMMIEGLSLSARKAILKDGIESDSVRIIHGSPMEGDVKAAYESARQDGYEGIVLKDLNSKYEPGERSDAWVKVKASETADCRVVLIDGCSLVVDFEGRPVRVGSGIPAKVIEAMRNTPKAIIGTTVEVAYQEITPSRSMRHPAFKRFRCDK